MWCEQNLVPNEVFLTFELEINRFLESKLEGSPLLCNGPPVPVGARGSVRGSVPQPWVQRRCQVKEVWALAEHSHLGYSQWGDPEGCFPSGDVRGVSAHGLYEQPWHLQCAGWGALGFTTTYQRGAWTWPFSGLLLRCFYTSEVWCPTCLSARCRRPLFVPRLFYSVQGLCFPKSKLFFPLIWSSASPGTQDILAVPGIVTSLGPSLSSGDSSDHKPVK